MSKQNYILTLFDEQIEQNWSLYHDALASRKEVKYLCGQLERCPATQKAHWQAFCQFHQQCKQRGTWFKNVVHRGIHFEACSRLTSEAINYGCKEETRIEGPREYGQKPVPTQQGKKATDYGQLHQWVKEEKWLDIPFEHVLRFNLDRRKDSLIRYFKEEKRLDFGEELENPWTKVWPLNRNEKRKHYWVYSRKPGLGKTFNFLRPLNQKFKAEFFMLGVNFQDHFSKDTQAVLIDEYNEPALKFTHLNQLCDGYYPINRKGKEAFYLDRPYVIVCSNKPLTEIYNGDCVELLLARFNVIDIGFHEESMINMNCNLFSSFL